nr:hypothetical protein [Tanacetum cinerariifolium]
MGIRTLERDSWAQTVNGISGIYLDIFQKRMKDGPYTAPSRSHDEEKGLHTAYPKVWDTAYCNINYGVTYEAEAKWRNSRNKTKTFDENCYLLLYAVSSNEDTAYQHQLITRIRVMINSRSDATESPSETALEMTSDYKCGIQELLPPLPKLIGAEPNDSSKGEVSLADLTLIPSVYEDIKKIPDKRSAIKLLKKAKPITASVPSLSPDKNVD